MKIKLIFVAVNLFLMPICYSQTIDKSKIKVVVVPREEITYNKNDSNGMNFYQNDLVIDQGHPYTTAIFDNKQLVNRENIKLNIEKYMGGNYDILCYSAEEGHLNYIYLANPNDSEKYWRFIRSPGYPALLNKNKWNYVPKNPGNYRLIGIFTGLSIFTYEAYYFEPKTGNIMFVTYLSDDMNDCGPELNSKLGISFWLKDSINPLVAHPNMLDSFYIKVPPTTAHFDATPVLDSTR